MENNNLNKPSTGGTFMSKKNYLLLLTAILMLMGQMLWAKETKSDEADTRIWSRHYWQNIVKTPPPFKTKNIEKQPAEFKGSMINSKHVRYIDSPDVPVTTIFKGIIPFLIADVFHVALLLFVPAVVLFLPNAMG